MITSRRAHYPDVIPALEYSVRCGCGCFRMVHECPFGYRQRHAEQFRRIREVKK